MCRPRDHFIGLILRMKNRDDCVRTPARSWRFDNVITLRWATTAVSQLPITGDVQRREITLWLCCTRNLFQSHSERSFTKSQQELTRRRVWNAHLMCAICRLTCLRPAMPHTRTTHWLMDLSLTFSSSHCALFYNYCKTTVVCKQEIIIRAYILRMTFHDIWNI